MDRITRVECKKERDNDKSILEEEDTLKEHYTLEDIWLIIHSY